LSILAIVQHHPICTGANTLLALKESLPKSFIAFGQSLVHHPHDTGYHWAAVIVYELNGEVIRGFDQVVSVLPAQGFEATDRDNVFQEPFFIHR
jgi:hypothetical protein